MENPISQTAQQREDAQSSESAEGRSDPSPVAENTQQSKPPPFTLIESDFTFSVQVPSAPHTGEATLQAGSSDGTGESTLSSNLSLSVGASTRRPRASTGNLAPLFSSNDPPPRPASSHSRTKPPAFEFDGALRSSTRGSEPPRFKFSLFTTGGTPRASRSPSPQPPLQRPDQPPLGSSPARATSPGLVQPRPQSAGLGSDREPDGSPSPRGRSSSPRTGVSNLSLRDDSDGGEALYDPDREETPDHPFFAAEFQSKLREGEEIARRAVEVIDGFTDVVERDETLVRLREDAQRVTTFRPTTTKTVAVLGDSGEGKSSLINAILGFPGIAKTGDLGSSCTSVVTEYHQKKSDQSAPIAIEVECMTQAQIEDVLAELLWSFRLPHLLWTSSPQEISADPDYVRHQRESAQAWSALHAAFGNRRGFADADFQDVTEEGFERNKALLIEWSREIQWPEGVDDGLWVSTASSADECWRKTGVFMTDQYFPFTKVLRIYVDSRVLKSGVVLADLPGLQDTNLARVKATEDYLMRCDSIFIVAGIQRAITDQSLRSSLFTVFARHVPQEWDESAAKSLNIAVVCTKSDDINVSSARNAFCGDGKQVPASEMEELESEIEAAKGAANEALRKELKLKRKLILINARNQHVREGLRAAYAKKAGGRELEVFGVSSKLYEKHAKEDGSVRAVRTSGIPALRRFCHALNAGDQLREAEDYLWYFLTLVTLLSAWTTRAVKRGGGAESASGEAERGLREAIARAHPRLADATKKLHRGFGERFRELVLAISSDRESRWKQEVLRKAQEWRMWHHFQYKAWCVNGGCHETPKVGRVDWNATIIWTLRRDLAYQWVIILEQEIPDLFDALSDDVETVLEDLKQSVLELCGESCSGLVTEVVQSGVAQFANHRRHCEEHFAQELGLIQRYSSETNHNSYLLREMLPIYRAAASQSGKGMGDRQHKIVEDHIGGDLFPNMHTRLTEDVQSLASYVRLRLLEAARGTVAQIERDLNVVLLAASRRRGEVAGRLQELAEAVEGLRRDVWNAKWSMRVPLAEGAVRREDRRREGVRRGVARRQGVRRESVRREPARDERV